MNQSPETLEYASDETQTLKLDSSHVQMVCVTLREQSETPSVQGDHSLEQKKDHVVLDSFEILGQFS